MTSSMARLKLELHHVIENASAFLHFLHAEKAARGSRSAQGRVTSATLSKVKDALDRTVFYLETLDVLLGAQTAHELRNVQQGFALLQREVKVAISSLASALSPLTPGGPDQH
jgi:hypothetical protein